MGAGLDVGVELGVGVGFVVVGVGVGLGFVVVGVGAGVGVGSEDVGEGPGVVEPSDIPLWDSVFSISTNAAGAVGILKHSKIRLSKSVLKHLVTIFIIFST